MSKPFLISIVLLTARRCARIFHKSTAGKHQCKKLSRNFKRTSYSQSKSPTPSPSQSRQQPQHVSRAPSRKDLRLKKTLMHKRHNWLNCDQILVAAVEKDYRKLVNCVRPSDSCIELGCHEGVTTQLIALCGCEFVLGVDKSAFSIARANKRLQKLRHGKESSLSIKFLEADALDIAAVRSACTPSANSGNAGPKEISVIFIDVSGNRAPGFVLDLLEKYDRVFRPRLFVIKSFKLENVLCLARQFDSRQLTVDPTDGICENHR